MKILIFPLLTMVTLCGCYSRREIQVEMVSAQLVKIDTIYRFLPEQSRQQLTWRDDQNMEYVSYAPLQTNYHLGTLMAVLRTR